MKVAIIPARGGSKRIPRKNLRPFLGRPIMAWPVDIAVESGLFDRVVVSTDDPEIAAVAREWGAETPFLRPAALADDHTGTTPVVAHALEEIDPDARLIDFACCIYPTAPLLAPGDLVRGLGALLESGRMYAFSITSYAFPIQRAVRRLADGTVEAIFPEHRASRSQDLEAAYHDAGQFYWGRREAFAAAMPIFAPHSVGVVLPRYRVADIDTDEDWRHAELLMQALRLGSPESTDAPEPVAGEIVP